MWKRSIQIIACAALLNGALLSPTALAGNTYKWKDDNGQWQYTQLPPSGKPFEVIKDKSVKDTETPAPAPTTPAAAPGKPGAPAKAAAPTDTASQEQKACDTAKGNKKTLTEFTRIRVTGKDGEQRLLSDDERAEKMKQAEKDIAYFCKE